MRFSSTAPGACGAVAARPTVTHSLPSRFLANTLSATAAQVRRLHTCIDRLALPAAQVKERLAAYDAVRLEDLTAANARLILTKLDAALVERDKKTTAKEP